MLTELGRLRKQARMATLSATENRPIVLHDVARRAEAAAFGEELFAPRDRVGWPNRIEEQAWQASVQAELDRIATVQSALDQDAEAYRMLGVLLADIDRLPSTSRFFGARILLVDETFADGAAIDREMTPQPLASSVGPRGGLLLAPQFSEFVTPARIVLDRTSQLWPGDWRRVESTFGTWSFPGGFGVFHDLGALVDRRFDTSVVLEAYRPGSADVPAFWRFEEGLRAWAGDPPYTARLRFEYETVQRLSTLYVVPGPSNTPATLKSIRLDLADGSVQALRPMFRLERPFLVSLGSLDVRSWQIELEQRQAEPAYVAYFYRSLPNGAEVALPAGRLSALGFRFDARTGDIYYPQWHPSQAAVDQIERFWPEGTDWKLRGLPAQRYSVHLQEIGAGHLRYETVSYYVSRPYAFVPFVPDRIWAEVDAVVPFAFGAGSWVRLSLSFDNGETWVDVVDPEQPVAVPDGAQDVRIRLELRRPDSDAFEAYSPAVLGVRLWMPAA